jgi:hypothetical protein
MEPEGSLSCSQDPENNVEQLNKLSASLSFDSIVRTKN